MGLRGMRYRIIALVAVLLAVVDATATVAAAKPEPGCPDSCGNVSIPYPFGTSPECFLNNDFFIKCDNSTAFFRNSTIPVVNITIDDGGLHVTNPRARDCYDSVLEKDRWRWLYLSNFTINNRNKFTVIGCDSYAYIRGYIGNRSYFGGCTSWCDSDDSVTNGSCVGFGCCQVEIPKGLNEINITAYSYYNHTDVSSFNPCTYAFVVEESKFSFSSTYLSNITEDFPMVIDWAINGTCTEHLCGENAWCNKTDGTTYPGYRCHCNQGYEGNPYLSNGCQDIDECAQKTHNCTHNCVNEIGSFTCRCPKGQHGDGVRGGNGCTPNLFPVLTVTLGVGISIVLMLMSCSWLYLVLKKRKLIKIKEKFFQQNGGFLLQQQLSQRNGSSDTAKIFTTEELQKATNNYAEDRIIGRGGFGTVFIGFLTDNSAIAIKKSKIVDQSQVEQFVNEVVVLSQINHRNVVRLLGCCLETEVPLLVYEFVSNGTLFEHIHNKEKFLALSWENRLKIAAEIAEVLSYLHSAASTPIIHRDVKSSNILLDDNYTAKVSDFGASKLVPMDETQLSTMVQGTLGYLDPEYLHTSQLTEKSDVYSFGVVLVELLTGKKALLFDRPEEHRSLANYFLSSLNENCFFEILENHVVTDENKEKLKEVGNLAARCLRVKGDERPTMKEVAMELEGLRRMQKRCWDNPELNAEAESVHLLAETNDAYYFGHDSTSATNVAGYDSLKDQILVAIDDGR
ncbi:Wall-associated receptor kinase [Melia azedarach]|uniref:Wall-associated receptor kinase n=1 Tax=Melia azedarach TaxID=155640 RepID=A0ACC1WR72_MELAZ|nr:Wall-associated receptor kinase [Melia azedarach]